MLCSFLLFFELHVETSLVNYMYIVEEYLGLQLSSETKMSKLVQTWVFQLG